MAGNPAWLSRQFQGQFPGMEDAPRPRMSAEVFNPYSAARRAVTSPTVNSVIQAHNYRASFGNSPKVGLRGSIPERVALGQRVEKTRANEGRLDSLRQRVQEETFGEGSDLDAEPHPVTGMPSYGAVSTYKPDWEGEPAIGMAHGALPHELRFQSSAATARRQAGSREFVPTHMLGTVQPTVSMSRVHQAMENPETRQTPRFPQGVADELPHVYEATGQHVGERTYTLIDGNHRASADTLSGRLFTEAYVLRNKDIPKVSAITNRIDAANARAERTKTPEQRQEIERRTQRKYYGDAEDW